jgi:hypothetical protein
MSRELRYITIAAFAVLEIAATRQRSVPVLTVCEALQNRLDFNGKVVVIVGRLGRTTEGSWLAEDCEKKLTVQGFTWPSDISLGYEDPDEGVVAPPFLKGFRWDHRVLSVKLAQVQRTTKLRVYANARHADSWVAIYGRFETRNNFLFARIPRGELIGNGYGHLSASPAQLIAPEDGIFRFASDPPLRR